MGYRCGFLILAEKENETTKAIEEIFRQEAERDSKKSNDEFVVKDCVADNGLKYRYYKGQGCYLSDYNSENWFRKPGGIIGSKKNQKYKILFESSHSNNGFDNIKGDRSGCWKTAEGNWVSYYDQQLYYAIVDKLKEIKNVDAKLFTFEVNDGIKRTRPKFIEDWPGEIL
jgi:hypothetical protein